MTDYDINLDDKFGQLAHIDVAAEGAANEPWFNQTLTTVNDSAVRLGVLYGDFHWHHHDSEDEFRTRAPERTVVLMVEPASVQPTGD
jgi:hypothetical protein